MCACTFGREPLQVTDFNLRRSDVELSQTLVLTKSYNELSTKNLLSTLLRIEDATTDHYIEELLALRDGKTLVVGTNLSNCTKSLYTAIEKLASDEERCKYLKWVAFVHESLKSAEYVTGRIFGHSH